MLENQTEYLKKMEEQGGLSPTLGKPAIEVLSEEEAEQGKKITAKVNDPELMEKIKSGGQMGISISSQHKGEWSFKDEMEWWKKEVAAGLQVPIALVWGEDQDAEKLAEEMHKATVTYLHQKSGEMWPRELIAKKLDKDNVTKSVIDVLANEALEWKKAAEDVSKTYSDVASVAAQSIADEVDAEILEELNKGVACVEIANELMLNLTKAGESPGGGYVEKAVEQAWAATGGEITAEELFDAYFDEDNKYHDYWIVPMSEEEKELVKKAAKIIADVAPTPKAEDIITAQPMTAETGVKFEFDYAKKEEDINSNCEVEVDPEPHQVINTGMGQIRIWCLFEDDEELTVRLEFLPIGENFVAKLKPGQPETVHETMHELRLTWDKDNSCVNVNMNGMFQSFPVPAGLLKPLKPPKTEILYQDSTKDLKDLTAEEAGQVADEWLAKAKKHNVPLMYAKLDLSAPHDVAFEAWWQNEEKTSAMVRQYIDGESFGTFPVKNIGSTKFKMNVIVRLPDGSAWPAGEMAQAGIFEADGKPYVRVDYGPTAWACLHEGEEADESLQMYKKEASGYESVTVLPSPGQADQTPVRFEVIGGPENGRLAVKVLSGILPKVHEEWLALAPGVKQAKKIDGRFITMTWRPEIGRIDVDVEGGMAMMKGPIQVVGEPSTGMEEPEDELAELFKD